MSKRYINDTFWTDAYIEKLTPDEKLIFIYLLTNPLNNIAGMYEIRSKRIGFETGYDIEVIENILKRFEKDKKVLRNGDFLVIVNHIKNQVLNPSVLLGCVRIIEGLSKDNRQAVTEWVQSGLLYLTLLNLTIPNGKPDKSIKKIKYKYNLRQRRLALLLIEKIETNFPNLIKEPNVEQWANDIRLMNETDGVSIELIELIINWVHGGEIQGKKLPENAFWSKNIRSAGKLREKRETILAQIMQKYKIDSGILSETGKELPQVIM